MKAISIFLAAPLALCRPHLLVPLLDIPVDLGEERRELADGLEHGSPVRRIEFTCGLGVKLLNGTLVGVSSHSRVRGIAVELIHRRGDARLCRCQSWRETVSE